MTSVLSVEGRDGKKWTGPWVYKIQSKDRELSGTARILEKWKTITGLPAYLVESGIIVPYLGDCPASDEEIAEALFDIYARTRTIIFDAAGSGKTSNFLKWKGKAVCVDYDLAVRRGSRVSEKYFFSGYPRDEDERYLEYFKEVKPMTVSIVEVLLLLEKMLPYDYLVDEEKRSTITRKLLFLLRAGVAMNESLIELIRYDEANEIPDSLLVEFLGVMCASALDTKGSIHLIQLAARYNMPHLVRKLVSEKPALVHRNDAYNQSPLLWAACMGHHDIVAFLISQGADIYNASHYSNEYKNWMGMDFALANKHRETIQCLAKAMMKRAAVTRDLPPAERDALLLKFIEKLQRLHTEIMPITEAVVNGLLALLKVDALGEIPDSLLREFLNASSIIAPAIDGSTHVIHLAAKYNMPHLVRKLVTDNPALANIKDGCNQSPLLWAASRGHHDIVAFLINQGADIYNATRSSDRYNNWTVLNNALAIKNSAVVACLVTAIVATHKRTPVLQKGMEKICSIFTDKLNEAHHHGKKPLNSRLVQELLEDSIREYIEIYHKWRCCFYHGSNSRAVIPVAPSAPTITVRA